MTPRARCARAAPAVFLPPAGQPTTTQTNSMMIPPMATPLAKSIACCRWLREWSLIAAWCVFSDRRACTLQIARRQSRPIFTRLCGRTCAPLGMRAWRTGADGAMGWCVVWRLLDRSGERRDGFRTSWTRYMVRSFGGTSALICPSRFIHTRASARLRAIFSNVLRMSVSMLFV